MIAASVLAGTTSAQTHLEGDWRGFRVRGGAIAPLIASQCKVAFVIGSSAPGLPMDEVEIYSVENSIGIAALGPADSSQASAYVRELVAVAYHGKERARLDSLAVTLRDRPWFFPPPPQENSYWSFSRRIAGYDPIAYWKQVNVPVLLLYGEADQRVPPGYPGELTKWLQSRVIN